MVIPPAAIFACTSSSNPNVPLEGDASFDATFLQEDSSVPLTDANVPAHDASTDATVSDGSTPSSEAGEDVGVRADAPPDAIGDTGVDAGADVGPPDAGAESGADAGSPDAGVDTGTPPLDAGFDAMTGFLFEPTGGRVEFALGSDGLYFMTTGATDLYRAPYGGGPAVSVVANANPGGGDPGPIATDVNNVYWEETNSSNPSFITYGYYVVPIGSGAGSTPSTISTSDLLSQALFLVAYDGVLYISLNGGGFERLPAAPSTSPSTNAPVVMSGTVSCGPEGCVSPIAVTPNGLFWVVPEPVTSGGGIYTCPLDADAGFLATGTLFLANEYPIALAADATNLYWMSGGTLNVNGTALMTNQLDASTVVTITTGQGTPDGIAVDSTTNPPTVYWTNRAGSGSVGAAPAVADAAAVTLATGQGLPEYIQANGSAVFWSDWNTIDGGIWEAPKP